MGYVNTTQDYRKWQSVVLEEIMARYWKSLLTNIFGAKREEITGG